jgi:hypothetical protein
MSLLSFNPFQYAERLAKTGLDPETAKEIASAQMEVLRDLMEEKLAAKEDLTKLATKDELKAEIKDLRSEMRWLFGVTTTILAIIMAVLKFLH